jgi:hypothetical protein
MQDGAKPTKHKNFSPQGWPILRQHDYSHGLWMHRRFKKDSLEEREFKSLRAGSA